MRTSLLVPAILAGLTLPAAAQSPRPLLPIPFERSAEAGWLRKPVLASRLLDDMRDPATWAFSGTGTLGFPAAPRLGDMRVLRVDMQLFRDAPAPTRSRLSSVNLRRAFGGEDWSGYNRLSFWVRATFSGIPVVPLQVVLHNDGTEKVPDRYQREGIHYVSLADTGWHHVVWEIDPLARDRITSLEVGYWVNRMFAGPGDHVAFEIGRLELQRVVPDVHTGWIPGAGKVAYSHSGYQVGSSKTAVAAGLDASRFELVRVGDNALGDVVLRAPVTTVRARNGEFQEMDFSRVNAPGRYLLRAGSVTTEPFRIGGDVWEASVWKTLNFFYGNRCGFPVPGVHGIDHLDWFATHEGARITMSGGWHDAGDLSQGLINTGEGTYTMFALAAELAARGGDPALVERLIEEGKWGLDWVLRVRFPGGYRIGFGSHNVWSDNVVGNADDRSVEAKDNPNANYIAAAAEAIAARVLASRDPALAARALATAEDDWEHAIVGVEGPSTWHTPAFAASRMELAAIGITASLELWRATGTARYAEKAVELARVVTGSQQVRRVGRDFPLSGFFYTGPDRDTVFHQFHRAADQAPILALAQLVEAMPAHPDWMRWYATVARYAEYQKRSATTTAPYGVLPAYVYRLQDTLTVADSGDRYGGTRAAYAAQVLAGMPMGDGWYLRAFPVWFARKGNYGVLLSQAKGLSVASRLRGDSAGLDLAQRQAQWVVGRNPFTQSTMYGEGHDWAQQYSVSSGDFVGTLPVGMQSRGVTDLPYWPSQNMYVYKEVWVHSNIRWLALVQDLLAGVPSRDSTAGLALSSSGRGEEVTLRLVARGSGAHGFALRVENLAGDVKPRMVTLRDGAPAVIEWKVRRVDGGAPWVAVVVQDGEVARRAEAFGQ
ncbi:MAG TPA: glycoside hydrolase family 9 protein [Gemmatimonadaceae bacterium]